MIRLSPLVGGAAAAVLTLAAAAAAAQGLVPSGQRFVRSDPRHPIAPGVYTLEAVHSGACVGVSSVSLPNPIARTPFLAQIACPSPGPNTAFAVGQIEIVAQPDGGYALQPAGAGGCATVARGVILGAAAINVLPCGASTPGASVDPDQRFTFRVLDPSPAYPVIEIRTPNEECWDVREQSRYVGAELIRFACNGQANQRFRLRFVNVPTRPPTMAAANAVNWFAQRTPAAMISVVETRATNFYGADYASAAGLTLGQCKARCADEAQCRAISLVNPGVQGPSAMCWLKSAIPGPNTDVNVASAIVRPYP